MCSLYLFVLHGVNYGVNCVCVCVCVLLFHVVSRAETAPVNGVTAETEESPKVSELCLLSSNSISISCCATLVVFFSFLHHLR